jgi:pimeloyl-ACP methyl ester carboxylesterase
MGRSLAIRRLLITAVLTLLPGVVRGQGVSEATAVEISQAYLASHSRSERRELAAKLVDYRGDVSAVLDRLHPHTFPEVAAGYFAAKHLANPELLARNPDDLLYYLVPKSYRPDRPTGLIIFLHGGGATTPRTAPRATLPFRIANDPPDTHRSGEMFAATGMIAVGPSAPWDTNTSYRWCTRSADEYLSDVIRECKTWFNIDDDRVFLLGHSMGGFGVYQHVLRSPDRFAAVIANSGSWSRAFWPAISGTPLCTVQGVHDARPGVRWHYTDVAYGRFTDTILTQFGLDHVYLEQEGKHSISYGRPSIGRYFESVKSVRRDPYYPHVVLASPQGFSAACSYPVDDNRWLSLDKSKPGDIEYDELRTSGSDDFNDWKLSHRIGKHSGAVIDATNAGRNTIVVATKNVARFTVWLHPKMIDVAKPVTIVVDGKTRFHALVKPSLATALESYRRRYDWKLVYPIKITLDIQAGTPAPQ